MPNPNALQFPTPGLTGDLTTTVIDPTGAPLDVITVDQAWSIRFDWNIGGALVPIMDGEWKLQVALEALGPGPEFMQTRPANVQFKSVAGNPKAYSATVDFAVGDVSVAPGETSTPFHVVALLTLLQNGGAPGPIATLVDMGVIEIFDPS